MPERPDLHVSADKVEAAVEWLIDVLRGSPGEAKAFALVLARLEELEYLVGKGRLAHGVTLTALEMCIEERMAAEADARAMREAIIKHHYIMEMQGAREIVAAALRGWSPSWYRA